MFILGIDIGTQSLKAVVLGEGLTPLGSGAASYQPQFPQPLWAEQDPRLWLDALGLLSRLNALASRIDAGIRGS